MEKIGKRSLAKIKCDPFCFIFTAAMWLRLKHQKNNFKMLQNFWVRFSATPIHFQWFG